MNAEPAASSSAALPTQTSGVRNPLSSTGSLALWLGIQLAIILIVVLRIPLAARYTEPAERLGPQLLLITQVVATGLLFPFLLRDIRSTVQVLATAFPFQLAAAYLGGLSMRELAPASAFVAGWIMTLGIWAVCLRSPRSQMLGVCVASCLTLGGGTLRYLRLEFPVGSPTARFVEAGSPLLTTAAALEGDTTKAGWLLIVGLALAALLFRGIQNARLRRRGVKPLRV